MGYYRKEATRMLDAVRARACVRPEDPRKNGGLGSARLRRSGTRAGLAPHRLMRSLPGVTLVLLGLGPPQSVLALNGRDHVRALPVGFDPAGALVIPGGVRAAPVATDHEPLREL